MEKSMLTSFVTTLVITNVMAASALSWAVVFSASGLSSNKKSSARRLTDDEPIPIRLLGRAEGAGRPFDIAGPSKEELHELPSAA
jgi:hypothetical protein